MNEGFDIISQLIETVKNGFHNKSVYRGHADQTWSCNPSAFRKESFGITDNSKLAKWKTAAGRFANPRPQNDFEWLVLAQHYGIATPLLDWTTNPLIALFFACQRNELKRAGCVLRFNPEKLTMFAYPDSVAIFKIDRNEPGFIDASSMNARSLAQDSAMTLHSQDCSDISDDTEAVFEISESKKWKVLKALRVFGFSPDRLYFDLNTAAREFREELEIDYLLG